MDPDTPQLFVPFAALILWYKKPLRFGSAELGVETVEKLIDLALEFELRVYT